MSEWVLCLGNKEFNNGQVFELNRPQSLYRVCVAVTFTEPEWLESYGDSV